MSTNTRTNSVYILGIEAKDVYLANNLVNPISEGYVSKNKKHYLNALDFSLDLIKMREIYEKVYRNRRFTYTENGKEYTDRAVVIKFNYAYKEYNKASSNIYVKAGYTYNQIKDQFDDNSPLFFIGDELIAIRLGEKCKPVLTNLPEYFAYDKSNECYILVKEPKVVKSKSELRRYLYENGFMCNGIKFVRDKRSSGSSRVGKCMFLDSNLYYQMSQWEKCGLEIDKTKPIDLAAYESYIALPQSSCIDTMELQPENFLVIDDYTSTFEDTVIAVEYEDGELKATRKKGKISNSIFDGESLGDESIFWKYPTRSMLLLRNRFFKTACFKCKLQQWFADNGITDISQLNGFTLAKDIKDIKIVTTPSSIKYLKFGTLQQWFDNLHTVFGIVKHEKPTHYLDGKMVQCHYQLINTLQLTEEEVQKLCEPTLDYIVKIRQDPDILKYHIKYPYDSADTVEPLMTKNEVVLKLMGMNSKFSQTKMYADFRKDLIKSMIDNVKQGHILINGNYSTMLGNGVEMLQHAIGRFNGESVIGKGNIYSKRFPFGKTLIGSRSPHICSGNILLSRNTDNELISKYFDLSNEVVYVNAIGENIQQRLNGCDYDSDTIMLSDNEILINAAKKNYHLFDVPTSFVSAKKTKRYFTAEDKCDLDIKTSVNKIGEIVNLSQYLQSIMWDKIYKDIKRGADSETAIKNQSEVYRDICKLAVLSGIEIDKAKKEFDVNTQKELHKLKAKYTVVIGKGENTKIKKPMFFKMITLNNGYSLNPRHKYEYFNTPMDYLQKLVNRFNFRKYGISNDVIPFSDIIVPSNVHSLPQSYANQCREKANRILNLIKSLYSEIQSLYINYDSKNKEEKEKIRIIANDKKDECAKYINDISLSQYSMYLLIKELDNLSQTRYVSLIFNTIFRTPNQEFFKMVKQCSDNIYEIVEDSNGDIELFGYKYAKMSVNCSIDVI